jgi:hypothetical protein
MLTAQLPPVGFAVERNGAWRELRFLKQAISKKRISALPYLQTFDFS